MKKYLLAVSPVHWLIALYAILAIAAASQAYVLTARAVPGDPVPVTKYNNYVIFKHSHFHLLQGNNLYQAYPEEHWDLFKYTPTFALFFGCFTWVPDWLGLTLWNLLNVWVFFLAILYLPGLDDKKKLLILLLSAVDAMTSLQNSQSNVLVAGLIIMGFALLERNNLFLATLCLVATFYIKIFGIAALVMLLFYPGKYRSILYTFFWMVILWIIPATIIGFRPLMTSYMQYMEMLKNDQSVSLGLSVMGWLKSWFGLDLSKSLLAFAGFAVLCLPLVRYRNFTSGTNRILFLAALMIWMVIFNHKAESPTFIIATSGVFIWFFSQKRSTVNMILLCMVVLFTSLSATDLFPGFIRENFFEPYVVKVVPCILIWLKIVFDLMLWNDQGELHAEKTPEK